MQFEAGKVTSKNSLKSVRIHRETVVIPKHGHFGAKYGPDEVNFA
jgi:hypothetical protein